MSLFDKAGIAGIGAFFDDSGDGLTPGGELNPFYGEVPSDVPDASTSEPPMFEPIIYALERFSAPDAGASYGLTDRSRFVSYSTPTPPIDRSAWEFGSSSPPSSSAAPIQIAPFPMPKVKPAPQRDFAATAPRASSAPSNTTMIAVGVGAVVLVGVIAVALRKKRR